MFPSSGVFNQLVCPDPRCTRPYCSFWHQKAPPAVVSQPETGTNSSFYPGIAQEPGQSDPYSPYSQPIPSFSGYSASVAEPTIVPRYDVEPSCSFQGYVATSSEAHQISQVPTYVPTKIPTIPTEETVKIEAVSTPSRVKEEPVDDQSIDKVEILTMPEVHIKEEPSDEETALKNSSSPASAPLQQKLKPKPEKAGNLLECAQSISEIDAEIERLKRLREQHKQKAVELRGPVTTKKDKKSEYVPKMETKIVGYGYTPTPLAVLEKKKEEKKKIDEEKTRKREESAKVKAQRTSSSELSELDLFGEEPPAVKKPRLEKVEISAAPVQKRPSEAKIATKGVTLTVGQLTAAKERIARPAAATVIRTIPPSRKVASAVQQMHARMEAAVKEKEAAAVAERNAPTVKKFVTLGQKFGETRPSIKEGRIVKPTSAATSSTNFDAKPALKDPTSYKVPSSIRLASLAKMYQELRTFLPPPEAKIEAENEEKAVLDRVKHRQGYQVAVVHSMKKIRDMRDGKRAPSPPNKISHDQLLLGKHFGSVTVKAKGERLAVEVTEKKLYEALVEGYVLTEEQMEKNSYPTWISKGIVKIEPSYYDKKRYKKTFVPDFDLQRVCVRCTKEFELNIRGNIVKDPCVFHLKNKARLPGKIRNNEAKYPCCGGDDSMEGCQLAPAHVFDTLRESELLKFQETPCPSGPEDPRSRRIYALDCEMVYTVWGPALARITVVDLSENVVLDEIVRPDHTVIDYNTTFSGITEEQLGTAIHTHDTVMQRFFELANSHSILIGHSLESDLKAMRLVHKRVVDTSLLYPHRIDEQKKRGLRELCLDKLGKSIQDDIDGHDSKEDSIAALQLVIYKTKFDGKLK